MTGGSVDHDLIPIVSVVVPVLNERAHIDSLVDSLLAQDIEGALELLLVDGGSTDGTVERGNELASLERSADRTIRVLKNPHKRTPFAFNLGIQQATGEFVAILGAHAVYEASYLRICVDDISAATPKRVAAGGVIKTVAKDKSLGARLVVDVLSSRFASSGSSFRTQTAGPVDNIPFPVVRRSDFDRVGPYNEALLRNQDNEMNSRLLSDGVELRITDRTSATYFPVPSPRRLFQYARRNGWWNAKTVALGLGGMRVRHLIPTAFLGAFLVLPLLAVQNPILRAIGLLGATGIAVHLVVGAISTLRTKGVTRGKERILIPPLILAFHLSYGFGTASYLVQSKEPG